MFITTFINDLDPYHVIFGVILGAGGCFVGLQLIHVVKAKYGDKINKKKITSNKTKKSNSLIHSPDHPIIANDDISEDDVLGSEDISNGYLVNPDTATNLVNDEQVIEPMLQNGNGSVKLLNLLYNLSKVQSDQDNIFHRGISCNSCNANPLTGTRFKCVNCVDYDVCLRCEPFCNHDLTHVFLKIDTPIPPMANPRTALLPVFYPGKNCVPSVLPWNDILSLRENSHFNISRIGVLYEQYRSLADDEKGISKEVFCLCLGPLSSKRNLLVEQLFKFYDANDNGFIDFKEFTCGMSILAKGMKDERLRHIFKGYDVDGDGFISRDDFQQMLKAYHRLSMELVRDVVRSCEEEMMATYDDSGNRPISAVFNAPIPDSGSAANRSKMIKSRSPSTEDSPTTPLFPINNFSRDNIFQPRKNQERLSVIEAMTQDAISELVDQVMRDADTDKDGKLSESEFFQYTLTDTSLFAWFEAIDTIF